jgi:outer membrane protein OmpA-like peptidoglycan-associated protein
VWIISLSANATTFLKFSTNESLKDKCFFSTNKKVINENEVIDGTFYGKFDVYCKNGEQYKFQSTLSPFSTIKTKDNQDVFNVRLFMSQSEFNCDDLPHNKPSHVFALFNNEKNPLARGFESKKTWHYCLKVYHQDGKSPKITPFIDGVINIEIGDQNIEWALPKDAKVFKVGFEHNQSVITQEEKNNIDRFFSNIGDVSQYYVQLHAHASLVGDVVYNYDLSIMRLKHVRDYIMMTYHVPLKDTWGQAWGESRPFMLYADDEKSREKNNRRVDIVLHPKD